ncbi:Succinate dehydrogenase subunit 7A, mitochondrial [Castilleja foliolosa]|uniref:Succinate dehydrogenase subunit 7A, mitochondrial n=1 Tax=Castilleja foliolosa TaxID=1961234 RepID=A0ABD3DJK5_9LAMI
MAFLLDKTAISALRLRSPKADDSISLSRRRFHVELGAREKALLAEDPSLKRFKSHKKTVSRLKKVGDVLTVVVVAGCCYEIYVRATMREEGRREKSIS